MAPTSATLVAEDMLMAPSNTLLPRVSVLLAARSTYHSERQQVPRVAAAPLNFFLCESAFEALRCVVRVQKIYEPTTLKKRFVFVIVIVSTCLEETSVCAPISEEVRAQLERSVRAECLVGFAPRGRSVPRPVVHQLRRSAEGRPLRRVPGVPGGGHRLRAALVVGADGKPSRVVRCHHPPHHLHHTVSGS
eukprot:1189450-Prorocentrum_minimum.AAC.1